MVSTTALSSGTSPSFFSSARDSGSCEVKSAASSTFFSKAMSTAGTFSTASEVSFSVGAALTAGISLCVNTAAGSDIDVSQGFSLGNFDQGFLGQLEYRDKCDYQFRNAAAHVKQIFKRLKFAM